MKHHLPLLASAGFGAGAVLTVLLRIGFPYHGTIAAVIYAIGWIFFLLSLRRYKITAAGLDTVNAKLRRFWGRFLVGLALPAAGYLIFVIFPVQQTVFLEFDEPQLRELIAVDAATAGRSGATLETLSARANELAPLARKIFTDLTEDERIAVLDLWRTALDHFLTLETLKLRHRHFYQINWFFWDYSATRASRSL